MTGQINIQEWEQNKDISDMPELKVYHLDYFSEKNKTWVGTPAKQKYRKEDLGFKKL